MEYKSLTNISSYNWPDTTVLDFNPVTRRYEALVIHRRGGVGEREKDHSIRTANLWSISKEDLFGGRGDTWSFQATLSEFPGDPLNPMNDTDGAHTGGGVVDEVAG